MKHVKSRLFLAIRGYVIASQLQMPMWLRNEGADNLSLIGRLLIDSDSRDTYNILRYRVSVYLSCIYLYCT